MNKQNNMKGRQRGRSGGKQRPQGRNPNYDGSNSNRMRGNAQQLLDKYLLMARDATSAGDRVLAENYFQHADHYYRVVNARLEQQGGRRPHGDDRGGQSQGNGEGNRAGHGGKPSPQLEASGFSQGAVTPPQVQYVEAKSPEAPGDNNPSPSSDSDIGLPPGILGVVPAVRANEDDAPQGEGGGKKAGAGQQSRRSGRGDKSAANPSAGE